MFARRSKYGKRIVTEPCTKTITIQTNILIAIMPRRWPSLATRFLHVHPPYPKGKHAREQPRQKRQPEQPHHQSRKRRDITGACVVSGRTPTHKEPTQIL